LSFEEKNKDLGIGRDLRNDLKNGKGKNKKINVIV
jgi:hypothetical protein